MPNIIYTVSTVRNRFNGKNEMLVALTFGHGKRVRGKTRIYIGADRWNVDAQRVVLPRLASPERQDLVRTQNRINELSAAIMQAFVEADESAVTRQWLATVIDRFHHPDKYEYRGASVPVSELFAEFIKVRNISDGQRRNYRALARIIERFERYCGALIPLSEFTTDTVRQFEDFLRNEIDISRLPQYRDFYATIRKVQPRGEHTIYEVMHRLRAFFSWCVRNEYLKLDPFTKYSIKPNAYGKPIYITIEERTHIEMLDLSAYPDLAVQRDIFVFQCCIGCRAGDLLNLTKNDVIGGAVEYLPHKTREKSAKVIRVPLNAVAQRIYERYAENGDTRLLPFGTIAYYNKSIKRIFRLAKLDRLVTVIDPLTGDERKRPLCDIASSHLARRTFVGNLYKQARDLNLVCALSGHTAGSKAVARYYDVDEEMRRDLVKMIE